MVSEWIECVHISVHKTWRISVQCEQRLNRHRHPKTLNHGLWFVICSETRRKFPWDRKYVLTYIKKILINLYALEAHTLRLVMNSILKPYKYIPWICRLLWPCLDFFYALWYDRSWPFYYYEKDLKHATKWKRFREAGYT